MKTITAYDVIADLDQNAYNWYNNYMYAINTDDYAARQGFEFTRQIYSSYFSIAQALGLESRNNYTELPYSFDYRTESKYITKQYDSYDQMKVEFKGLGIRDGVEPGGIYVIDLVRNKTDDEIVDYMSNYVKYIDSKCRGLVNANILIVENEGKENERKYVVDSGDYFMISPTATDFTMYYPGEMINDTHTGGSMSAFYDWKLRKVDTSINLINGWVNLVYYNTGTKELFEADTQMTARDIIRSLIEVTGAFFKIDRYGIPRFLYSDKAGLYPENGLYPNNDLFPLKTGSTTATMDDYISMECEDYEVTNYGRIQIVKQDETNDSQKLVQWEYKGSNERNTYLIDDNIFYSNSALEYEYGSMPMVSEMLENMYNRISGMSYTPHTTQAVGIPFIETGDRLSILTKTGGTETFIFRRTMSGIHSLKDVYEAEGPRWNRPVGTYNYVIY